MDNYNGWAILLPFIPFILFAVIVLIVMVAWTPSDSEPKAPSPDPLYDWAEEGDFKRGAEVDVRFLGSTRLSPTGEPTSRTTFARGAHGFHASAACELGCVWVFIGRTVKHAEALREEHYEREHADEYNGGA